MGINLFPEFVSHNSITKKDFHLKTIEISLVSAPAARGHRQERQGAKIAKAF
jgi:hypothetical protein